MRYISYTGNDPFYVAAAIEACETDTVALINCSVDWIYLGYTASRTKLVSPTTILPIVRFLGRGSSCFMGAGANLLFALNMSNSNSQQSVLEILRDTAIARGLTGASIQSNDVMYNGKQIGMVAPFEEMENGRFAGLFGLTLSVDFNKVEANLLFPDNKWEDKPNTTNIRDWLMGIKEVRPNVTVTQIVNSLKATISSKYTISITNGTLSASEIANATALKNNKYTLDSYIRYGEW